MMLRPMTLAGLVALVALSLAGSYLAGIAYGWFGELEGPGIVTPARLPPAVITARETKQQQAMRAAGRSTDTQILFGDLHVHTTYSLDAFSQILPINMGEGSRPLADACDFARYCSALDFWSINDHAETHSPRTWRETQESIRQCNAVAGETDDPDVVAFLGWEWSQSGLTADTHFGHKNVILRDTASDSVPTRAIGSALFPRDQFARMLIPGKARLSWPLLDFSSRQTYFNFFEAIGEWMALPYCEQGVPVRDLPATCAEVAPTPRDLFAKLNDWGYEAIVIPHGNAWGHIVPPGAAWDRQLADGNHDPRWQRLIEIYSGHGNSEEYRDWREVRFDANGEMYCPEPTQDYTPACWRAGEIIRQRCAADGLGTTECESRSAEAVRRYLATGNRGHHTIPGQTPDDWMDDGQCRDCFLPAFNLRPLSSAQYALAAVAAPDQVGADRLRFGIIGSSDIHRARPGVGYKEFARHGMTDASGPRDAAWAERLGYRQGEPLSHSIELPQDIPFRAMGEAERRAGYLTTGGLAAVHSEGRGRGAIWDALKRREVYGTSGPRILLWFELLNGPDGLQPMGSDTVMAGTPRFRVRATGAFKQRPGCPDHSLSTLGPERLQQLCLGECYHPSDERYLITRIEVVRIRPRTDRDVSMQGLIESPWQTFACPLDPSGCTVEFEDTDFAVESRDMLYYVRAIQEPTPKVNGGNLRCEYDDAGNCIKLDLCTGGYPTAREDDCLADVEERAWSSPIFVDYL